jgi:DNA-binding GntR family transcriptional regulator
MWVYVVRACLEGLATRLAAVRLRTIDLEEMADCIARMEEAVCDGEFRRSIEAGRLFHAVIHRECQNRPLIETLAQLSIKIDRFRYLAASFEHYDISRVREHAEILEALYARDDARAETAMVLHITQSANALIQNIGGQRR